MDAAEPPRIVFESAAQCADGDRAEEVFRQGLAPARAPGLGWIVTVRIAAGTASAVSAEGEVTDPSGKALAHHAASGNAADCAGLARELAAWAANVLQTREPPAPAADSSNPPLQPLPAPASAGPPTPPLAPTPAVHQTVGPAASDAMCLVTPNAPVCQAQREVDRAVAAQRRRDAAPDYEMPALELGMGAFLMVGGGAGGYAGVTPFLVDEVAQGVFLRPSAAVGDSLATNVSSVWAAGRLDTCVRLPGRYAGHNGIQLDLCGGPDVGVSYVAAGTQPGTPPNAKTLPYVALGPSVDLHAEVGSVAVSLRGVIGIDVARQGFVDVTGAQVDAPMLSWRLELDFSWALHSRLQ